MREEYKLPFGYSIFCDDVRNELGGKTSYIGVYNGLLIGIGAYPIRLARLCIEVFYIERFNDAREDVRIFIDCPSLNSDGPFRAVTIKGSDIAQAPMRHDIDESDPIVSLQVHFEFTPLVLPGPDMMKVRAQRGDIIYKLGALQISVKEPSPQ